jgi:hypothetical protein
MIRSEFHRNPIIWHDGLKMITRPRGGRIGCGFSFGLVKFLMELMIGNSILLVGNLCKNLGNWRQKFLQN